MRNLEKTNYMNIYRMPCEKMKITNGTICSHQIFIGISLGDKEKEISLCVYLWSEGIMNG